MKLNELGFKDRKGKLMVELVIPEMIEGVAEVLTFGAKKYKPNTWQNIDNPIDTHYGALMRHLLKWRKGIKKDSESKLNHMKHVLTNAMFLLYLNENE